MGSRSLDINSNQLLGGPYYLENECHIHVKQFTIFNSQFSFGHLVALGPLTYLNLNISTIWVRDPWVTIQIKFWGSLLSTTAVLHTCKIVNYFYLPIYFWQGGPQLSGNGLQKVNQGGGKSGGVIGMGQGGGVRGQQGWNVYFNEVFSKTT